MPSGPSCGNLLLKENALSHSPLLPPGEWLNDHVHTVSQTSPAVHSSESQALSPHPSWSLSLTNLPLLIPQVSPDQDPGQLFPVVLLVFLLLGGAWHLQLQ